MFKRLFYFVLVLVFVSSISVCVFAQGEKEKLDFWYLWGGNEALIIEEIIANYNASQDKYEVVGLCVPDTLKVLTAIGGGEGPDISDQFSSNVAGHASKGIYLALDELIARDQLDIDDYIDGAIESCIYEGTTYALPLSINIMALYYNKALLKEAGYNAPPKTDLELMDIAYKTTKVETDGSISVLGFPDFPTVYYTTNMSFAFGGDYINEARTELTPDNEGTIKALQLIQDYRKKYGYHSVISFNASAGGYVTPTDPFILGQQALRIDGPWLVGIIKDLNPELEFGVAALPYLDGHPESAGGGELSSSTMFIPSNSKHQEGAWDFMKYICSFEGNVTFITKKGDIPARVSLLNDPNLERSEELNVFNEIVKLNNLKPFPAFSNQLEFAALLGEQAELVMTGKKSPEEAMAYVKKQSKDLLK
ncbi:MAG: ABC transporter substrate-binding protein [Actinomycetia bacterium]|nr:ABC transporter substrate-binding protein [Actinomycetes bacterium]